MSQGKKHAHIPISHMIKRTEGLTGLGSRRNKNVCSNTRGSGGDSTSPLLQI
jgi:hypothetical protein